MLWVKIVTISLCIVAYGLIGIALTNHAPQVEIPLALDQLSENSNATGPMIQDAYAAKASLFTLAG